MTENKQNTDAPDTAPASGDQSKAGGSAASTQRATENSENKKTASDTGSSNSIKETVGQAATQVARQAKDKAVSLIGEQKTHLAAGINSIADSIRQIGEQLGNDGEHNPIASLAGKYGDSIAGQVERFSQYVEVSDLKEVARDVEQFARRNPAVFVGGAFALGVLAARFLKSSGSGQSGKGRSLKDSGGSRSSQKANMSVQAS